MATRKANATKRPNERPRVLRFVQEYDPGDDEGPFRVYVDGELVTEMQSEDVPSGAVEWLDVWAALGIRVEEVDHAGETIVFGAGVPKPDWLTQLTAKRSAGDYDGPLPEDLRLDIMGHLSRMREQRSEDPRIPVVERIHALLVRFNNQKGERFSKARRSVEDVVRAYIASWTMEGLLEAEATLRNVFHSHALGLIRR